MLSFSEFLLERIVNLGFSGSGNREPHASAIHDIIRTSYRHIGGYLGLGHGTEEESKAIYDDIHNSNHAIKMYRHDGEIKAAVIYKLDPDKKLNRKLIAAGTDNSKEGKHGLIHHIIREDGKMKRAWGEFSGKMKDLVADWPSISPKTVSDITGKPNIPLGDEYLRRIGDIYKRKSARGHP